MHRKPKAIRIPASLRISATSSLRTCSAPHDRRDICGRVEQSGAGLRGEELSWRHERLDQLRIRPAMIQRSCGLIYQGARETGTDSVMTPLSRMLDQELLPIWSRSGVNL